MKHFTQDHGISVVGSNQTYIYQNFVAGWQIADFGGAVRFTSAVRHTTRIDQWTNVIHRWMVM